MIQNLLYEGSVNGLTFDAVMLPRQNVTVCSPSFQVGFAAYIVLDIVAGNSIPRWDKRSLVDADNSPNRVNALEDQPGNGVFVLADNTTLTNLQTDMNSSRTYQFLV